MPIDLSMRTSSPANPQDTDWTKVFGEDPEVLAWRVSLADRLHVGTGGISSWDDRLNKGMSLVQTDEARRPSLVPGAFPVLGRAARNAIRFDKTVRDHFDLPEQLPISAGVVQSFALVMVLQIAPFSGATSAVLGSVQAPPNRVTLLHGSGGGLTWRIGSGSAPEAVATLPFEARPGAEPHILMLDWDAALHRASISADGVTWFEGVNLDAVLSVTALALGGNKGSNTVQPVTSPESFDLYDYMARGASLRSNPRLSSVRAYLWERYRLGVKP